MHIKTLRRYVFLNTVKNLLNYDNSAYSIRKYMKESDLHHSYSIEK
jgi:hypothetical protein